LPKVNDISTDHVNSKMSEHTHNDCCTGITNSNKALKAQQTLEPKLTWLLKTTGSYAVLNHIVKDNRKMV